MGVRALVTGLSSNSSFFYVLRVSIFMTSPLGVAVGLLSI